MSTALALQQQTRPYLVVNNTLQAFNADYFSRFIDYTDRKDSTVKGYITCIKQFALYLENNGITQPVRADIKAYRDYLESSTLAPGTQHQYLRAVKHFFRWTASEGLYPNIADNIHGAKVRHDVHKKDALQREDVKAIADSIDTSTEQGSRLYAMYMLCVICGLRTIEIHRADICDLKTVGGISYLYLQGKGHDDKDAPVMLIPEVKAAIDAYLQLRTDKYDAKSPLFVSTSNRSKGGRVATTTISTMLKQMLINAGYDSDRLTAHSLRHTSGTGAHKCGLDLYSVQHLMRHSDPATSEIYIHDDEHEKAEAKGRKGIYDYYFCNETLTPISPELESELMHLDAEQQQQVLNYIKSMKGGK